MSCNRVNRVTLPFPLVTRDSWGFVVGVMFVRCDDINEGPHYKSIAAVYSPNTYMWTSYIYTVSCSQAAFLLAEWFHMIYSPFAFLINIDILIVGSYLRTQDTVIVFLETEIFFFHPTINYVKRQRWHCENHWGYKWIVPGSRMRKIKD